MPSRYRVAFGWVVGLAVIALARPTPLSMLVALPLVVIGEGVRVWASGHIEKARTLATGGPYAHTRNPLYVGSLLIALAVGVASASPWAVLALAAYFLAFYPTVVREEEAFLARTFPEPYAEWAGAVPAFWPRLTPRGARSSCFEWSRVTRNREWRTVLALPVVAALLYMRTWLGF